MFLPYKISSNSIRNLAGIGTSCENFISEYNQKNQEIKEYSKKIVSKQAINGTDLQELWFPVDEIGKFAVFISHSHKDIEKLVVPFASWLYSHLGLRCFIDSQFWQYADDLLNILDKQYAWQEESRTYNYKIRNFTTSNIHIMLSMALMKMMNKTETVIFIDSDNSVTYKKEDGQTTPSPWIYEEVNFAKSLENKIPERWLQILKPRTEHRILLEQREFSNIRNPNIYYRIDMSNFYELTNTFLNGIHVRDNAAMDEFHKANLRRFRRIRRQING
jgi:hypothetical protein